MAGRTSINEVASVSATHSTMASGQTAAASAYGATSTASLTTATTTVSAIRDVSTASGRPSRRDQLNSTTSVGATHSTTAAASATAQTVKPGIRSGVVTTAGSVAPPPTGQVTSRSYAGSPTGHYPPGPVNGYGRGNVPQSISSSAFTVGTSRYTR